MRNYVQSYTVYNFVTKEEFESILYAVDNHDPIHILGGRRKEKYV
jgi:hypothetical protein